MLVSPAGETVIANTPVKEQRNDGRQASHDALRRRPRCRPICWPLCLASWTTLEAKTKDGVLVRTYATPDNVKHTQFALDTAVKTSGIL